MSPKNLYSHNITNMSSQYIMSSYTDPVFFDETPFNEDLVPQLLSAYLELFVACGVCNYSGFLNYFYVVNYDIDKIKDHCDDVHDILVSCNRKNDANLVQHLYRLARDCSDIEQTNMYFPDVFLTLQYAASREY